MSDLPRQPDQDVWQPPNEMEKNWAMIAHMGAFAGAWVALGAFAPLIVLLTKGKESDFVRRHAVESLNFQINALGWIFISVILFIAVIGVFMLAAFGVYYLIVVIWASVTASRGHRFRYPMLIRFVK